MSVLRRTTATAVCCLSCLLVGWALPQEGAKETAENADQVKMNIAVLAAKGQIVRAIGDRGATAAKLSATGRALVERKYDVNMLDLRQKYGLERWEAEESVQIIAMRTAAGEFLEALAEARDNVRKKAQKKKGGGATGVAGPQLNLGGFSPAYGEHSLSELNKWRGDVIQQGEQFHQNLQSTGEENDIKQTWRAIQDQVIAVFDQLQPALLADKHVQSFHQEGLIQSWSRVESREDPAMRLPGCTKVHTVSYRIVDAYGTARRGRIAVGLVGARSWELAKDNSARGGFYELIRLDD